MIFFCMSTEIVYCLASATLRVNMADEHGQIMLKACAQADLEVVNIVLGNSKDAANARGYVSSKFI